MSFFSKIKQMFSRRRGETEAPPFDAENTSNEQQNEATRERGFGTTFYFNSYQHGFTNGVLQVKPDEDSFFRFLKHDREVERLEEQRRMKVQELEKLETELALKKPIELEKKLLIASHRVQEENLNAQIKKLEEDEARHRNTLAALRERREKIKPEYPWAPALMFFVVGLCFVAADISITRDITANGFKMKKLEGWIFAVGLAMTAFLVKPFLDRVFEKPFQTSGHILKKWYRIVLGSIVVVALGMLFFLGLFRSEANVAVANYNKTVKSAEALAKIYKPESDTVRAEYAKAELFLDESKKNPAGNMGLIISGIIFAIGGGICLSISFPSLNALLARHHFIPRRMKRVRLFIKRTRKQVVDRQESLKGIIQEINCGISEIELLGIDILKQQIAFLKKQIEELIDLVWGEKALRDQMLYLDGKERGAKYSLDDELRYSFRRTANTLEEYDETDSGAEIPGKRKYNRRPYVKLRKLLSDLYNKSKNGIFYEESGIHIPF